MSDDSTPAGTVPFFGETFTLNDDVSEFALMEFAEAAAEGQDGDTMGGLASLLRLVLEVIAPDDRVRFRRVARANRAKSADLVAVLTAPVEAVAERPTGRSSDSSDGPVSIAPKSAASSAGRASTRLAGRPDLQLAVQRTRTA